MPQRLSTAAARRHLGYLRQQVRAAGLTLHTRLRRINLPADQSFALLPAAAQLHIGELLRLGYQVQLYLPSADPRQDRSSPWLNSLARVVSARVAA